MYLEAWSFLQALYSVLLTFLLQGQGVLGKVKLRTEGNEGADGYHATRGYAGDQNGLRVPEGGDDPNLEAEDDRK
jgi:hypothetical protein